MVRKSLIVAALLALSSPLAAQDEYVWTSNRPDAHAPLGVTSERTLDLGELEVTYRFTEMKSRGVRFLKDTLPIAQTLQIYQVAPLTLSHQTHFVMVAFGVLEDLTVEATAEFGVFEREQLTSGGIYYRTGAEELGDITASAIYEVYRGGPFLLNISLGGVIPTGKSRTYAVTPFSGGAEEALPYDMRPGGGTFAFLPGISGEVQNEYGSLGAQFKGRINVGTGVTDYTRGDVYEANAWAAYRFNDVVSASAGARWQSWGHIEGADPQLDPSRDPLNDPVFLSGKRVDMPLGVNFVIPGTGPLGGHRVMLEAVYPLHHDYDGPQMGLDWGLNVGYRLGL